MVDSGKTHAAVNAATPPVVQRGSCLNGCSRGHGADVNFPSAVLGGREAKIHA